MVKLRRQSEPPGNGGAKLKALEMFLSVLLGDFPAQLSHVECCGMWSGVSGCAHQHSYCPWHYP